jgi:hypothetical protein
VGKIAVPVKKKRSKITVLTRKKGQDSCALSEIVGKTAVLCIQKRKGVKQLFLVRNRARQMLPGGRSKTAVPEWKVEILEITKSFPPHSPPHQNGKEVFPPPRSFFFTNPFFSFSFFYFFPNNTFSFMFHIYSFASFTLFLFPVSCPSIIFT